MIEVLKASQIEGARVEVLNKITNTWSTPPIIWNFGNCPYRVLAPVAGKTRHISAKDWDGQATVWVRFSEGGFERMVTMVTDIFYVACDDCGNPSTHDFDRPHYKQYSFDRKTWMPFTVTEHGEMRVVASTEENWQPEESK